jgi:hypothetical protein
MFIGFQIFGFELPLWALFLIGIIGAIVAWKFIKFAIKIMLIVIVFFIVLFVIDYFSVIKGIQDLLLSVI